MQNGPTVALMDAASAKPATTNSGALTGTLTRALAAATVTAIHALNAFARKLSLVTLVIKYKNTLNLLKIKNDKAKKAPKREAFLFAEKIEIVEVAVI